MPELPVTEVRPAELRLPEIKREQIVRSLSEIHLPNFELPDGISKIDWRAIDPSTIDFARAMAGVAAVTRLGRPVIRRSRVTLAIGALVVVGLAAAALFSTPAGRERAGRTVRGLRTKMEMRAGPADTLEVDEDVPDTSDSSASAPLEAASLMDATPAPLPEEAASPA